MERRCWLADMLAALPAQHLIASDGKGLPHFEHHLKAESCFSMLKYGNISYAQQLITAWWFQVMVYLAKHLRRNWQTEQCPW